MCLRGERDSVCVCGCRAHNKNSSSEGTRDSQGVTPCLARGSAGTALALSPSPSCCCLLLLPLPSMGATSFASTGFSSAQPGGFHVGVVVGCPWVKCMNQKHNQGEEQPNTHHQQYKQASENSRTMRHGRLIGLRLRLLLLVRVLQGPAFRVDRGWGHVGGWLVMGKKRLVWGRASLHPISKSILTSKQASKHPLNSFTMRHWGQAAVDAVGRGAPQAGD